MCLGGGPKTVAAPAPAPPPPPPPPEEMPKPMKDAAASEGKDKKKSLATGRSALRVDLQTGGSAAGSGLGIPS